MGKRATIGVPVFSLLLVVISTLMAAVLLSRQDPARALAGVAGGATSTPASTQILAFSFQLGPGIEGIALIDHQNQTICIYQYELGKPAHQRFSLVAARSYSYDSRLTDYNNADPTPEVVKQWVKRAGQLPEPNRTGVKIIKK